MIAGHVIFNRLLTKPSPSREFNPLSPSKSAPTKMPNPANSKQSLCKPPNDPLEMYSRLFDRFGTSLCDNLTYNEG
jgi:hypothetical protein